MSEHLTPPQPERDPFEQEPRKSDDDYLREAIERANKGGLQITDAVARVIASQLHEGQATALYSLASTGAVDYDSVHFELAWGMASQDLFHRELANHLDSYVWARKQVDQTEAIKDWHKLWVGQEVETSPAVELVKRAQALYNQEATAQAFIDAFTKDELIALWEVCGDGMNYGFDDEVYDALARFGHWDATE